MTDKQKQSVKQAARNLCQAKRISLAMAIWAMKNAGYTREETAEWLGLTEQSQPLAAGG
jgi:predicted transcriptional regulator